MSYFPLLPVGATYIDRSIPLLDGTTGQLMQDSGASVDGNSNLVAAGINTLGTTWQTHFASLDASRVTEASGTQNVVSPIVFTPIGGGINNLSVGTAGWSAPYVFPTPYLITISAVDCFTITSWSTSGPAFQPGHSVNQVATGATGICLVSVSGWIIIQPDGGSPAFNNSTIDDNINGGQVNPFSSILTDVFDWNDGTTFDTGFPTLPVSLSNNLSVSFGSPTGHLVGDNWTFVASSGTGMMFQIKYDLRTVTLGDINNIGGSTKIILDDNARSITMRGQTIGLDQDGATYFDSVDRTYSDSSSNPYLIGDSRQLLNAGQDIVLDWENNIWNQSTTLGTPTSFIDAAAQIFYDGHGQAWAVVSEANSRRFYAATGIEAFTISNSLVNFGLSTRVAAPFEVARSLLAAPITRTTDLTLSDLHCSVYGDASSADVDFTLPSAASASGRIYIITRIDSSGFAVNIIGSVSGVTNPTLAQYDCWIIQSNGVLWYRLNP